MRYLRIMTACVALGSGSALAQAPQQPSPGAGALPDPVALFAAADTDSTGAISLEEWLAAGRQERGFDLFDTDQNGALSLDELKAGLERVAAMRAQRQGN